MDENAQSKSPQKIQIIQHRLVGMMWPAAWLFTIGFLHLNYLQGALAVLLWPYYLGSHFSTPIR